MDAFGLVGVHETNRGRSQWLNQQTNQQIYGWSITNHAIDITATTNLEVHVQFECLHHRLVLLLISTSDVFGDALQGRLARKRRLRPARHFYDLGETSSCTEHVRAFMEPRIFGLGRERDGHNSTGIYVNQLQNPDGSEVL